MRKVLASAIPVRSPAIQGGASQKDALPNQVGRPAAATRRIFQWGLLEIIMSSSAPDLPTTVESNGTRQVGPSPGQIQRTPPRVGRIIELHRFPVPGTARSSGLNDSCADSTLMTARATTSMRVCPHGRRLWVCGFGSHYLLPIGTPGPEEPGNCQPIWVTVFMTAHESSATWRCT